jgi:hypothetical protein
VDFTVCYNIKWWVSVVGIGTFSIHSNADVAPPDILSPSLSTQQTSVNISSLLYSISI